MAKWRIKVTRTTEEFFDVEAEEPVEAFNQVADALADGCKGDNFDWIDMEQDDPVRCCDFCGEPPEELFGLPCCREAIEHKRSQANIGLF